MINPGGQTKSVLITVSPRGNGSFIAVGSSKPKSVCHLRQIIWISKALLKALIAVGSILEIFQFRHSPA
ncbi:hypothetical protein A2154_00945 [Candidatus Gottesmanbacteria bacterium RBG_16_43_7]|uniref:Uncharacterized protein n=1 Tax=Candidatus Gottesmanbacteria bacterium RBG_16_43_7 TaxID=1798373 RepID=A0A1F5Z912_9BACT|nr:MAG: hypothetical protein A2154_00945 [Candidatus Gottesmanbacteria bacterium RBG_16_43_7]